MPCQDITETIIIKLDTQDRFEDYSFTKRVCGSNIGQGKLILDSIKGLTVDEILSLRQTVLFDKIPPTNDSGLSDKSDLFDKAERFLIVKHLLIIQNCLELLDGRRNMSPDDPIRIYSITHSPDGIELEADIRFRFKVEDIEPCSPCCQQVS